jgi:hypothetical protein
MNNINSGAEVLSTRHFLYTASTKTFVGDESELHRSGCSPIYNDSSWQGFWLESHKTGKKIPFVCVGTGNGDEDTDGEVMSTIYKVIPGYLLKSDPNNNLKVIIYNY